jgi:hypothetical protein
MANQKLNIWNWLTKSTLFSFPFNYDGWGFIKFLSDGRLACEWDIWTTNIWNVTTGQIDMSFYTQGKNIEQLDNGLLVTSDQTGDMLFWNLTNGRRESVVSRSVQQNFLKQTSIADYMASIDRNGLFYMWNVSNFSVVWSRQLTASPCTIETLSDGSLVTVSSDGWLKVWNVLTGFCYNSFYPFNAGIYAATMAANDTLVVTGPTSMILILQINADSQYQFSPKTLYSIAPYTAQALRVTNESILLAAVSGTILFYDLKTFSNLGNKTISSTTNIISLANFGNNKIS